MRNPFRRKPAEHRVDPAHDLVWLLECFKLVAGDADAYGTGYIALERAEDGLLRFTRLDPATVMIRQTGVSYEPGSHRPVSGVRPVGPN